MNQPLQARAGQNAPFRAYGFEILRGAITDAVDLTDSASAQTLIEAVDEALLVTGVGNMSNSIGAAVGLDAAGVSGSIFWVDSLGTKTNIGPLAGALDTLSPVSAIALSTGAFLLAPGEKITFEGAGGGGTGRFYPNVGLLTSDPSAMKAYRVNNFSNGSLFTVAEAPPGKGLVAPEYLGSSISQVFAQVWSNDTGMGVSTVDWFIDGVKVLAAESLPNTVPAGQGVIADSALGTGFQFSLPAGSKLQIQLTAASVLTAGSRVAALATLIPTNAS